LNTEHRTTLLNRRLEIVASKIIDVSIDCCVTAEINDEGLLCTTHAWLNFVLQKGTIAYSECISSFDGLLPSVPRQLEFAWGNDKGWIRTSLPKKRFAQPDSKFACRIETAAIDESTDLLNLSILFVDGNFWSTQNVQFRYLVSTEPLIGLFKAWSRNRTSMPDLKSYLVRYKEDPPVTGIWRNRPRYDFEKLVDWSVRVVSDFRPADH
jgi:hypothetical protein